jgi:DEAD/DEAH box helicase domain-containing protein
VRAQVVGYQRKRIQGQIPLSTHSLDLPPEIFETVGLWIEIDPQLQAEIEDAKKHFMGSIHAIEHAMISLYPLFVLCDRYDIGGISFAHHPQVGRGAIFIYDGYPGGIGLAEKAFCIIADLLAKTGSLLKDCPCQEGCPSCIHSPKCGSGNKPLDKEGAMMLLELLLHDQRTITIDNPLFLAKQEPLHPETAAKEHIHLSKRLLFFDLETQRSAEEVGGWEYKEAMGLAVGVLWDETVQEFEIFQEEEVFDLIERLRHADLVIGFNIKNFDYAVLRGYSDFPFSTIPTFDILEDVQRRLGFRLGLGHLAEQTLRVPKMADGLQSLAWFKAGEIAKVIQYCCQDVEITRQLFYYGQREGYLYYASRQGERVRLPVDWSLKNLRGRTP